MIHCFLALILDLKSPAWAEPPAYEDLTHKRVTFLSHDTKLALCIFREGFKHVLALQQQLVDVLKANGSEKAVDMDDAALRESLDLIGRFGFGKDFGATKSLEGGHASTALHILLSGRSYIVCLVASCV